MKQLDAVLGLRQPSHYIGQLESLRGWAILLVVLFHAFGISTGMTDHGLPADSSLLLRLAGGGNTGVTLFFVLSGFLLSLPFIEGLRDGTHVSISRYFVSRMLRIIPLYYTAVLIAWLATGKTLSAFKALLFIHIGFDVYPYSPPWWTLATEMQFYLLLPWLMLALRWRLGRWLVASLLVAWFVSHCFYLLEQEERHWPRRFALEASLFGRGTAFLVGAICCWFYCSRHFQKFAAAKQVVAFAGVLLLAVLLALLQWYGLNGQIPAGRKMPLFHDVEALIWGGLLLCALVTSGAATYLFINPAMAHFGRISYSLYIVHLPIFDFWIKQAKSLGGSASAVQMRVVLAVIVSFLCAWALSILCHHLIERPFLKLKAHIPVFSERLKARPATA